MLPVKDLGIPSLPLLVINTAGVYKILSDLQEHKASGPDGIPVRVLPQCAGSVAPERQKTYQASIATKYLSSDWRTTHITPAIFKN